MSYEIHIAHSAADFERVKQLRRAAFELELGYDTYAGLDDSIDDHSLVLLGTQAGDAVGTVRLTVRADGPLEDEAVLELERWRSRGDFSDAEIGQCSRLVVAPALRGLGLVSAMSAQLHSAAERRGLALVFIDASPALVDYYLRFGFRRFRPAYVHPILAVEIHPLVLFMGDSKYFEQIGSRLCGLARADSAARARTVYQRQFAPDTAIP